MVRSLLAAAAALVAAAGGPAQDTADVVKLDAEAFAAEVARDRKAAAAKYDGKTIEIAGKVQEIRRGGGILYFTLPSKSAGILGLMCVPKDKAFVGKVFKGQEVTVRGKYPGEAFGPQLNDAEIVKAGPSPALTFTAADMAREWARDREAAAKKWKDKVVVITGEVADIKANDVGAVRVLLKGADGKVVDCGFTAFETDIAERYKKGDRVKLVGEFLEFESSADGPALRFCLPAGK